MGSILNFGDDQVKKSISQLDVKTRPLAGPGVWLLFLLPLTILASHMKHPEVSEQYNLSCVLSSGLFVTCIIILATILKSKHHISFNSGLILPFAFICFRLYILNDRGLMFSVYCGLASSYAFSWCFKSLMKLCPHCFTFGEAAILTQGFILFVVSSSENIYQSWCKTPVIDLDIATLILQVGLMGVLIICVIVYSTPYFQSTGQFYALSFGILGLLVIPTLQVLLNQNPVLWIISLIFTNHKMVYLFAYWLLCVGIAASAVVWQISKNEHATTALRKYFHILAVAVYFPGLITACNFLYLASGVVLAIFIMLELIRILNIPPLGSVLQEGFSVYADEKDAGNLALTPIYLLVGCSLPMWLHPTGCASSTALLPLSGGLLSIGVGDTLASTIGSRFGKYKWAGTNKTIEGTMACITGQVCAVLILYTTGFVVLSPRIILTSIFSISVTSFIEAQTDQVDNLVLPLLNCLIM